ncbi:MAG: tubulin/FtsZ family protein [Methanomicrobiales archaeon]
MRVLAIGLGGAGSRIVDRLHEHDRRSRLGCMHAVAVDTDPNTLMQVSDLPESARLYFPSIDPEDPEDVNLSIDIEEIMTRIQRMETLEIDAILVCCGLGGRMAGIAPRIINEIRRSFMEPVFLMVTLPCRNEGKRHTARAVDQLEVLECLADAVLLFDNETWYRRVQAMVNASRREAAGIEKQIESLIPSDGHNPRDIYEYLNERIARRVGLLLRAGEFNEQGIEVAEVVLDAGEVLKTLEGRGYTAIGYAVEPLPRDWRSVLLPWRQSGYFIESSQQRAARIVSLAKKAVYEEVSVPCDLTSAERALVLIAGPSRELSMKGFQSVRKWIDRSIAGLEMRSGDYPVKNTRYVGIIVMLTGLANVPRVDEMKEIRDLYIQECEEERQMEEDTPEPDEEQGYLTEEIEREYRRPPTSPVRPPPEPEPVLPAGNGYDDGLDHLLDESAGDDEPAADDLYEEGVGGVPDGAGWLSPPEDLFDEEGGVDPDLPVSSGGNEALFDDVNEDHAPASAEGPGPAVIPEEQIEIAVDREQADDSNARVLANIPPRAERQVADMTRSTSVGGIPSPDNSVFESKGITFSKIPAPRERDITGNVQVEGVQRPKEGVFEGKAIRAGGRTTPRETDGRDDLHLSPVSRPKDDAYAGAGLVRTRAHQTVRDAADEGAPVSVRPREKPPVENVLRTGLARYRGAPERARDTVPGRGRLNVRDGSPTPPSSPSPSSLYRPAGRSEKKVERKKDDSGIDWF